MKDYYDILGVTRNASSEQIKKAFHTLAHKHHPHKGGDEKKFKEINEAYQVLSDNEKRAQYDQFGRTFEGAQGFGDGQGPGGFDFTSFWGKGGQGEGDFEFEMDDLGETFRDFFGFGTKPKADIRKGEDIAIDMAVELEETLDEIKKNVGIQRKIKCSRCDGNGAEPGSQIDECVTCRGKGQVQHIRRTVFGTFAQWAKCPECNGEGKKPKKLCNVCQGEGRVTSQEEIQVKIPAGVDLNQTIKFLGYGNFGFRGGKTGDLYVRVSVKEHTLFERRGDDIYLSFPISFSRSALGGEVEIPTLDRKTLVLKIPQGTESGKIFRISGRGIPHFRGYGRGHFYVKLSIEAPKKLTKRQKDLLERLKEEGL